MNTEPSRAIKFFGTEQPVPPPQVLAAGPLTAELEAGNLRHIRCGGVELIRAISFIVRDRNWGTYNPQIDHLDVHQDAQGFAVSYEARAHDGNQSLHYQARITGDAAGRLDFRVQAVTDTDFLTNRTGFVVLHPCNLAGHAATIEHTDGHIEQGQFPLAIEPLQPMLDLRCLTHEAAPGLQVVCRMEGDTYEMEDQRNWTDASYKTYTRPLALPWPYTLDKGAVIDQAVTLAVKGQAPKAAGSDNAVTVSLGKLQHEAPPLGVGLQVADLGDIRHHAGVLQGAGVAHAIGYYDLQEGCGPEALRGFVDTARALGTEPWLEAVIHSVEGFRDELAALGRTVAAMGSPFPTVLVSPAPDLKCTLPGSPWPPAPAPRDFFQAARAAFPGARLGGGMFSLFTEMNRKRPPVDLIDLVSFTTTAMLHAGDDISIMEGLESLPAMSLTAQAIAGAKPWAVGPSAIGMRMNPYGEAPFANPDNIRQAMNFNDPRHRALLGAAWALGFYARFAAGGAAAVTLGGAAGPFGLLYTQQDWPQPWYEAQGAGLFPMYHVIRGLAHLGGWRLQEASVSAPTRVQAVAAQAPGSGDTVLWVANLTAQAVDCQVEANIVSLAVLDETSFTAAAVDPSFMDKPARTALHGRLRLEPYAVVRVLARGRVQ